MFATKVGLFPAALITDPSTITEPGERGDNRDVEEQKKTLFKDAKPFAEQLQEGHVRGSALAGKVAWDLWTSSCALFLFFPLNKTSVLVCGLLLNEENIKKRKLSTG